MTASAGDSVAGPATSSKYDRQLIIALLAAPGDTALMSQATALDGKRRDVALPSEVVPLWRTAGAYPHWNAAGADALKQAMAGQLEVPQPITGRSRIYLVGEGNAADRTVAGCSADEVACLLADAGLNAAAMISIVADGAGRDTERADEEQADESQCSFASLLHRQLFERHGVLTVVHARLGPVRVVSLADGAAAGTAAEPGRKLTARRTGETAGQHHAGQSKLRFWWDGVQQRCEFAY
jgi:hypothetical protein